MLSPAQRTTILELNRPGLSQRETARGLGISRPTVRKVLRWNAAQVPELHRAEKAEPCRQRILELFSASKGNLVRVHEELAAGGASQRVMIGNTRVVVLRGAGRPCQSLGPRGTALLVHREQLPGGTHVLQLGGSESAGAPMVRPRQLHLQETYPRGPARVIRPRAAAPETAAGLDSLGLPAAPAHGGTSSPTPASPRPSFSG